MDSPALTIGKDDDGDGEDETDDGFLGTSPPPLPARPKNGRAKKPFASPKFKITKRLKRILAMALTSHSVS